MRGPRVFLLTSVAMFIPSRANILSKHFSLFLQCLRRNFLKIWSRKGECRIFFKRAFRIGCILFLFPSTPANKDRNRRINMVIQCKNFLIARSFLNPRKPLLLVKEQFERFESSYILCDTKCCYTFWRQTTALKYLHRESNITQSIKTWAL